MVDDELNDQQMLALALETAGITNPLRTVSSGNEAIRYLKGEGKYSDRSLYPYPGILMTDLKMPQGNGFSVLDYLQKNPEFRIVPTLVWSASADHDDICKAYLMGAHAYLQKPTGFNDLVRLLKSFHDFWVECEIPQTDESGRILPSQSTGKLSERYTR